MSAQQKFSVVVLSDGSPHIHAFDEMASGLFDSLKQLKLNADSAVLEVGFGGRDWSLAQGRWIVFGAMRHPNTALPYDAILYQTEQVYAGSPWFGEPALAQLRRHAVWDYSQANVGSLARFDVVAEHVPFAWYDGIEISRMPSASSSDFAVDVCFVGTLNARRAAIVEDLRLRGLSVAVLDGTYGAERDRVMFRAKVLVNVHYYPEARVHESARCLYAAANRLAVVSETSAGGEVTPGIVEVEYERLASTVATLVADEDWRAKVVADQHAGVCGIAPRMVTGVKNALERLPADFTAPRLVLSIVCCDEPATIRRALRSAKEAVPTLGAWCVSFNGTGDETPAIIYDELGHLPGWLVREPWVSYGHNRTQALRKAWALGSHALILDADEIVEAAPEALPLHLDYDGWECVERQHEIQSPKLRLVRMSPRWRYVGAVHELLEYDGAPLVGALPELVIRNMRDGAGSTKSRAVRYLEEAEMLRVEFERSGDPRAAFYHAQSLDCAGLLAEAAIAYARRAELGGFAEEAWMSLVRVAAIYERLGADTLVPAAYLRAYDARPQRAEPLLYLGRWYLARGMPRVAGLFLGAAANTPVPPDRLFVEVSAHAGGWQVFDELALVFGAIGNYNQAYAYVERALNLAPPDHQGRIRKNRDLFLERGRIRLAAEPSLV